MISALREKEGQTTGSLDVSLDQKLTIDQFHGFEINWWPAKIAETAMFLVDHQANRELAAAIGEAPDRLPIEITAHIHHGNALRMDWANEIDSYGEDRSGATYVFGNPPFIGQFTKTPEQTADMQLVWGDDYDGYLDYVTGWHAQAMKLLESRRGDFAYVTTNSITQGQPVPALFDPLYKAGWRIRFAHRTFSWDSEAPGKAAVHCVIVGFTKDRTSKQQLWDYPDVNGDPVPLPIKVGINPYLVDGPNVLVRKRMSVLSSTLPRVTKGSQATDGGHLVVERNEYDEVNADLIARKYLRPYKGSRETLRNLERWCLWLEDASPSDIMQSPILKQRVEACREWRYQQKPSGDAYKLRDIPHLFRPNKDRPRGDFICIPSVVSETRRYFTAAYFGSEVIISNLAYQAEDPDGLMFGFISSSMFILWQRTVGGRLESRLRFAQTLTWNTFPVPDLDDVTRERIIQAGRKVLEARERHPGRSLAEAYSPLAMDPELIKAHDNLDRIVDRAFGAPRKLSTEEQRLEILFERYSEMTR